MGHNDDDEDSWHRSYLFAHGEEFDVDNYLTTTQLPTAHVFRRGEHVNAHSSGFYCLVSSAENVEVSFDAAIAFLQQHRAALAKLSNSSGVSYSAIMIGVTFEAQPIPGAALVFPLSLARLALELGLQIGFEVQIKFPPALSDLEQYF